VRGTETRTNEERHLGAQSRAWARRLRRRPLGRSAPASATLRVASALAMRPGGLRPPMPA